MIKIMVVEDEENLRNIIVRILKKNGYIVYEAKDGEQALDTFYKTPIDLALLDIMLPKKDGLEVCAEIRQTSDIPIIFLTARDTEYDELEGFNLGADEYITKPFSNNILLTRIEAILKRCTQKVKDEITDDKIKISYREHAVYEDKVRITLTPKEFDLLSYIIQNKGITLSREQILKSVWGYDYEGDERTVDTHIKCIRLKLKTLKDKIKTIHKVGYRYEN